MDDYIKKENIKFAISTILIIVLLLFISGVLDEHAEKKHDKAYEEGYSAALQDYDIEK